MPRDIGRIIESLKNEAVGRCRDRLEQAAGLAKTMVKNGSSRAGRDGRTPVPREEYGVAVPLKRRHGL